MTPVRLYCNTLSPQFCAPPLQQATWASLSEKLQLCLFEKTKGVMEPPPPSDLLNSLLFFVLLVNCL